MKNWTHEIIEELRDKYSESSSDLTRFTKEKFGIEPTDTVKAKKIAEILFELENKNYIKWKAAIKEFDENGKDVYKYWDEFTSFEMDGEIKPYIGKSINGEDVNFANTRIEGRLTIEGLDYAIELRRERVKHLLLLYTTPLTTIMATVAVMIGFLTYYKATPTYNSELKDISLQLQTLQIAKQKRDTLYIAIPNRLLNRDNSLKNISENKHK